MRAPGVHGIHDVDDERLQIALEAFRREIDAIDPQSLLDFRVGRQTVASRAGADRVLDDLAGGEFDGLLG